MANKRVIKSPIQVVKKRDPSEAKIKPDFKNYLNIYEFDLPPLPGSGEKLKIKPLTTKQIKNLLMYEGSEEDFALMTQIFDDIIHESVTTPDFDLSELYLQDRFFLLLEIRKKTKGEVHEFNYTCGQCKSQSLQKVNLDELKVTPKPDSEDNIIKLTDDISVEMDFLKRKHEFEATEALKILKESNNFSDIQEQAEFALLLEAVGIQRIILPEGTQDDLTIFDKKYFLENIPKIKHQKIKDWFETSEWGVEFNVSIECPHCKFKEDDVEIRYDNFFF